MTIGLSLPAILKTSFPSSPLAQPGYHNHPTHSLMLISNEHFLPKKHGKLSSKYSFQMSHLMLEAGSVYNSEQWPNMRLPTVPILCLRQRRRSTPILPQIHWLVIQAFLSFPKTLPSEKYSVLVACPLEAAQHDKLVAWCGLDRVGPPWWPTTHHHCPSSGEEREDAQSSRCPFLLRSISHPSHTMQPMWVQQNNNSQSDPCLKHTKTKNSAGQRALVTVDFEYFFKIIDW